MPLLFASSLSPQAIGEWLIFTSTEQQKHYTWEQCYVLAKTCLCSECRRVNRHHPILATYTHLGSLQYDPLRTQLVTLEGILLIQK